MLLLSIALIWLYKTWVPYGLRDTSQIRHILDKVYRIEGMVSFNEEHNNTTIGFRNDLLKLTHPDIVTEDYYIFRDLEYGDPLRLGFQEEQFDPIPECHLARTMKQKFESTNECFLQQWVSLTIPFHFEPYRPQMGLLTKVLVLPGSEAISRKSQLAENYIAYLGKLEAQGASNECIKNATFMKKTYRFFEEEECRTFFKILASEEYSEKFAKQGIQYIVKPNTHRGLLIQLVDQPWKQHLEQFFDNGNKCGVDKQNIIVQEYIPNPMLYEGYKIEFRIYFLVVSVEPEILYFYGKSLVKKCALPFNISDPTKYRHVCNFIMDENAQAEHHLGEDDLYLSWDLSEVTDVLIQQGLVKDKSWLTKYLVPLIGTKLTHLFRTGKSKFATQPKFGALVAVDFVLDQNLDAWVMECNRQPQFFVATEFRSHLFRGLGHDLALLMKQYIMQRYLHLRRIIQKLILPEPFRYQLPIKKLEHNFYYITPLSNDCEIL